MSKKIYIDPGHGGSDPGAVGYVTERTVAEKTATYMNEYLSKNYKVQTKISKGTSSTKERAAEANSWGADLFVSIHFNAGKGDGYECYVYSENRKTLGNTFWKHVKQTGQNAHGNAVKLYPELNVLRLTNMPAILNEIAFVDNKKDIADWNEDKELKIMGIALAKAAAEAVAITTTTSSTTASTTSSTTKSWKEWIKALQTACNKQGFSKQVVDGIAGSKTLAGCPQLRAGHKGTITKLLQERLIQLGFSCGSSGADGVFGSGTKNAVIAYQKYKGLTADGIVGKNTWRKLLNL